MDIPATLEECYAYFDKILDAERKAEIKESKNGVLDEHFGLGLWIRNNWLNNPECKLINKLPAKNPSDFLAIAFEDFDGLSGIILRGYKDYLNGIREPTDAQGFTNRGSSYANKKRYDQAIADYTEAIRLDPSYALAFNNRGVAHSRTGAYDLAIADYTEAIRLDPSYALAFNNRSWTYILMRSFDSALADANESIRLNPNSDAAFDTRGYAYYHLAARDFRQALRLNPNNQSAQKHLRQSAESSEDADAQEKGLDSFTNANFYTNT